MLSLTVKDNMTEFAPGQIVEGVLAWQLDQPPKDAFLRLFWHTQGRGSKDVGVVEEQTLPTGQAQYEQPFTITLPAYPYSFSGTLISLQWAIELVLNKGADVQRVDILLSPWTEKLTLASLEMK